MNFMMNFVVYKVNDEPPSVYRSWSQNLETAQAEIKSAGGDELVIDFITITPDVLQEVFFDGFDENVLGVIESLFYVDSMAQALEGILTAVYRAGCTTTARVKGVYTWD